MQHRSAALAIRAHADTLTFKLSEGWGRNPLIDGYMVENGTAATILLAEDGNSVRWLLRRILTDHGYRVIEAGDGFEALDVASAHHGPIHLLLTDIMMPKLNGLALAKRLREQRLEMSVLFMSGYIEPTLVPTIPRDAVLIEKPFTPARFIDVVRVALASAAYDK